MNVSLSELPQFARGVCSSLTSHKDRATLLFLMGELGAGKTAFTQALATDLGIKESVHSPTYVLMKKYELRGEHFKRLIHIDAYRLVSPDEFNALRPEEFLNDPEALVVIEWPERITGALPQPDVTLRFTNNGVASERDIEVQ
jgi:tRNA threonylcarbamoyladenosine biosynthesis protein TsaE